MNLRYLPNIISIGRILLVVPITWLLLQREFVSAVLLVFAAGLSDALDGFLAKRFGWVTTLGSVLDPIADKLLLVASFVVLGVLGLVPTWLVVVVLSRDAIIVTGATAYYLLIGRYLMAPTLISKLNTLMQLALVFAVVFSEGFYRLPEFLVQALIFAVLGTTVLSGVDYVWTWGRSALRARRQRV